MNPQGSINENAQCAFSVGYRCKIKITEIPIKQHKPTAKAQTHGHNPKTHTKNTQKDRKKEEEEEEEEEEEDEDED